MVVKILMFLLLASSANAGERFALLVDANEGARGETPLRYASKDTERMRDALLELGGFRSDTIVRLSQPTADELRSTLLRLNSRLRSQDAELLVVYYSGHADANALHLGTTRLPWDDLRNLASGSPAATRLLIVDACRSGQATRVKGLKVGHPFAALRETPPEGFAILSSAAAGESAMESDVLEGSFFTHHFIAALRGMADVNTDNRVTLNEAFRYTADRTIASSAQTLSGVQHPTYLYEIKGKKELFLTHLSSSKGASLVLPDSGQYLVFADSKDGELVMEADVSSSERVLHLQPRRYFVQRRTNREIHEGTVVLARGATKSFRDVPTERVNYAQLVRKGGAPVVMGVAATWGTATAPIPGYELPATVFGAHFSWDLASLVIDSALRMEMSTHEASPVVQTNTKRYLLSLGARKVVDIGPVAASLGLRGGIGMVTQDHTVFSDSIRFIYNSLQLVPFFDVVSRLELALPYGFFVASTGNVGVYSAVFDGRDGETKAIPGAGISIGVGKYL